MNLPSRSSRRADEIRRRRLMQSHTARQETPALGKAHGRKNSRRRAASTITPPPVMARGKTVTASRQSRKGMKNGRRLHRLALGAPGVEMRLPSAPRLGLSWRVASFCLAALLGAALYYLWSAPEFRVQSVNVSGLKRLTRGDVNRELALRDQPVFTLDAAALEDELLSAFPEFSSAEVIVDFPNTVLITVTERTPVLAWSQDGRTILVDGDGKTFQARDSVALSSLPVVEASADPPPVAGLTTTLEQEETPEELAAKKVAQEVVQEFQPTTLLDRSTLQGILQLSTHLPPAAVLIYHPVHGFGWQDARGWPVFFGDLSNLEMKLGAYDAILEKIKATGAKPELISLQFVHAPYYRVGEQDEEEE